MYPIKKIFTGGINADDDYPFVGREQYLNAENIRVLSSADGKGGRVEPIRGFDAIESLLPTGRNKCIGGAYDAEKDRIIFCNWNENGDHGIYCLDVKVGSVTPVLMSSDVTGGLNFSETALIHSCFVIAGKFYWVNDRQNPPRRILIDKFLNNEYTLPVEPSVISWIRKPGNIPLQVQKIYNDDISDAYSRIKGNAYQFCYRYVYDGGEESTLSPLSKLINYNSDRDDFNCIKVSMSPDESPPSDVAFIDFVVRYVEDDSFFVIHRFTPGEDMTHTFLNRATDRSLDNVYKVKSSDYVPNYAGCVELAKNRAFMADIDVGYDAPTKTSLKVSRIVQSQAVLPGTGDPYGEWFTATFYVVTDITFQLMKVELPLVRVSSPLSPSPVQAAYYYYQIVHVTDKPYPISINSSDSHVFMGTDMNSIIQSWLTQYPSNSLDYDSPMILFYEGLRVSISYDQGYVVNLRSVFKSGGIYDVGIVFWDEYGRKCGIVKSDNALVENVVVAAAQTSSWATGQNGKINIPVTGDLPKEGDILTVLSPVAGLQAGEYLISSIVYVSGTTYSVGLKDRVTGVDVTLPGPATVYFSISREQATSSSIVINDDRDSGDYTTGLTWTLDNSNSVDEIPVWASYYAICLTKNLLTRFFFTGVGVVKYAVDDGSGGLAMQNSFTASKYIAVDMSSVVSFGIGYSFAEGDIALINIGQDTHALPVIGADGKYLLLKSDDVGDLTSTTKQQFEVYRPYMENEYEPFFEQGEVFKITNPGTPGRQYSSVSGTLPGDTYLIEREFDSMRFASEYMSPFDGKWLEWNTNAGRPNAVDLIGKKTLPSEGCFSDVLIQDTKVNGLSSFSALNTFTVDAKAGRIRRLVVASKVQATGSVMVAICENNSGSFYLGEQEITDTQGSTFIARSNNVISGINIFRRSYGTINPESVTVTDGIIFWVDRKRSVVVQYSGNDLFPASDRKLSNFMQAFCKDYKGGDINTGYDVNNKELLVTIPATDVERHPPLISYNPAIEYPYDIYDGKSKTVRYAAEGDGVWNGSGTWYAEKYIGAGGKMFLFKGGKPYKYGTGGYCNFFGAIHKAKIMYSLTPGVIHNYRSVSLQCNRPPDFMQFRTEMPYIQETDLLAEDFERKGDAYSASMRMDRLSPVADNAFFEGDVMEGETLLTMVEYDMTSGEPFYLRAVIHGVSVKSGTLISRGQ